MKHIRHLVVVLGDQLSDRSLPFRDFDRSKDLVWMAELSEESTKVWSSKQRIALFLSAMRHFAASLEDQDIPVYYHSLEESTYHSFTGCLEAFLETQAVEKVFLTRPGEYQVLKDLEAVCERQNVSLELFEDPSFLSDPRDFAEHAEGRKQLRMEFFYREMRRRFNVLMDGEKPEGEKWNYDASNQKSFGKDGPKTDTIRLRFAPDKITKEVLDLVKKEFADHPGSTDSFGWPVTREDALKALDDFLENHFPHFGTYQDAMWSDEPFLHHALVSSAMNLKLLDAKEVIEKAEHHYRKGQVTIESTEGFITTDLRLEGVCQGDLLALHARLPGAQWTESDRTLT